MNVIPCLLSSENRCIAGRTTIGSMVVAGGREHLWDERRNGSVDTIVLHYISAVALAPGKPFRRNLILKIFCDYGVSSHYLINRGGTIFLLVPEEMRAWHGGGSIMPEPDNRRGVNEFSIGIELMATPASGFTVAQYRGLAALCAEIERRHTKRFTYVGHEQVAGKRAVALGLRTDVKTDPGERFDWNRFWTLMERSRSRLNPLACSPFNKPFYRSL